MLLLLGKLFVSRKKTVTKIREYDTIHLRGKVSNLVLLLPRFPKCGRADPREIQFSL